MWRRRQRACARRRCPRELERVTDTAVGAEGAACRAHHIGHWRISLRRAQRLPACSCFVPEAPHRGVVVGPSVGRGAWRGGATAEGGRWRGKPLVFTEAAAGRGLRRSSHDHGCANPRSSHDRGFADPRPAVAAILPLLCAVNDPSRGRQPRLDGQAVPLHRQRGPRTLANSWLEHTATLVARAHRDAERLHATICTAIVGGGCREASTALVVPFCYQELTLEQIWLPLPSYTVNMVSCLFLALCSSRSTTQCNFGSSWVLVAENSQGPRHHHTPEQQHKSVSRLA